MAVNNSHMLQYRAEKGTEQSPTVSQPNIAVAPPVAPQKTPTPTSSSLSLQTSSLLQQRPQKFGGLLQSKVHPSALVTISHGTCLFTTPYRGCEAIGLSRASPNPRLPAQTFPVFHVFSSTADISLPAACSTTAKGKLCFVGSRVRNLLQSKVCLSALVTLFHDMRTLVMHKFCVLHASLTGHMHSAGSENPVAKQSLSCQCQLAFRCLEKSQPATSLQEVANLSMHGCILAGSSGLYMSDCNSCSCALPTSTSDMWLTSCA